MTPGMLSVLEWVAIAADWGAVQLIVVPAVIARAEQRFRSRGTGRTQLNSP